MKTLGKSHALRILAQLKEDFRREIAENYEHRARSCSECDTPGACCLDAHFVNVHISELEAEAVIDVLERLPAVRRAAVLTRVEEAIDTIGLLPEEVSFSQTYACPLYDRDRGCLVHSEGKPLACIHHACYENKEDLPPDRLLEDAEAAIDKLNQRTYRRPSRWLPIPIAITRAASVRERGSGQSEPVVTTR
jgi:hypothetical protein